MRVPAMNSLNSRASEPGWARVSPIPSFAAPLFAALILVLLLALPAFADPAQLVLAQVLAEENPIAFQLHPLDDLLVVPDETYPWERESTDDALAAAVSLGNDPGLERRNPFRKRSTDLFRTQRWVTVGQRDMLVRLRLRAKARKAVSVEVKF